MNKIKVMIVDDHLIVREGLKSLLESQPNIDVVGEAINGLDAIEKNDQLAPDVILMDISMPVMNGIEATRLLLNKSSDVKIIVLTMHNNKEYIHQILEAGARGYVLKNTSSIELVTAIETIYDGGAFFSSDIHNIILDKISSRTSPHKETEPQENIPKAELSIREKEILTLVVKGYNSREIGELLSLSTRTIETFRERIKYKLNLHSNAEIISYAVENGLVEKEIV